ncbi:MAG: class I SAM-dependent methyltransferase [Nanoarchaeota archaeon]|nr:class I SAM-dependent methyltransferase [Nanoarchaeota archaeon]
MKNNQKQEKDWGKMAENFDKISEYVVGKEIYQIICKKLSKEKNLGEAIEFGCGTGYFTKAIAMNAEYIIAADVSEEMLDAAKRQLKEYKNIKFEIADCKAATFPDKEFDTVLMVNLLHVIKEPHKALEESYRILKDGGLLITIDLTGYGMKKFEMLKLVFRFLRKMGRPPKADKGNLSPTYLETLAENAGFEVEENKLLGDKDKIKALYFKGIKR